MQKIFIPTTKSTREIMEAIKLVEKLGMPKDDTYIGGSFSEFAAKLKTGDTAVVKTLKIFASINEILEQTNALANRGVELRSIDEPWFGTKKLTAKEFAAKLFTLGVSIHSPLYSAKNTQPNPKLKPKSRVTAKAEYVDQLRVNHHITVVKACKIAGCSLKSYYTHRKES